MKKNTFIFLSLLLALFSQVAFAESPRTLDLQTVVYDRDGNITKEEFVRVVIQIVDEQGIVLFEEEQSNVPVANGAIKLDVGETVGGVSDAVLDPSAGRKFVNVLINGENPYDLLPLSSVPYAIWSDRALAVADGSIASASLADGVIEARHLSQELNLALLAGQATDEQIPATIARDNEVHSQIQTAVSNVQAPIIRLNPDGAFAAQLGETVQVALENIYTRLGEEISSRTASVTNLETSINNSITNTQQQITASHNQITNHENRITALENTPQQQLAFAGGKVARRGGSDYGFNVASAELAEVEEGHNVYRVRFAHAAENDNVAVVVTPLKPSDQLEDNIVTNQPIPTLWGVDRNGFEVRCILNFDRVPSQEEEATLCSSGFQWVAFSF